MFVQKVNKDSDILSHNKRLDKTRFSLSVPMKQSIQLQILANQLKRKKNDIIVEAISLYLKSENQKQNFEKELQDLKEELAEIKNAINKI